MALDKQVAEFYKEKNKRKEMGENPLEDFSIEKAREIANKEFNDKEEIIPIYKWEDIYIPNPLKPLRIRIFTPGLKKRYPVIIYFHGGGFAIHNIESHDSLCRKLSIESDSIVVSVDYSLAPENPYPAALIEGYQVLSWVKDNIRDYHGNPYRIALGGDSAGATLSLGIAKLSRDRKGPEIKMLILFYGVYGALPDKESPSAKAFGNGEYVLPQDMSDLFMEMYLPKHYSPDDPYLLPGRGDDLDHLPSSLVVTEEYDPLRDDGRKLVEKLLNSGSEVKHIEIEGMMHGFLLYWHKFTRAEELLCQMGKYIKEQLK